MITKRMVSKLTAESLAATIIGGVGSFMSNTFLNVIVPHITIILYVGGLVAGLWNWFSDGNLNGWIKLW